MIWIAEKRLEAIREDEGMQVENELDEEANTA